MKLAIQPEHRIIIIGTTRHPELADTKQLKGFFEKFLYLPYPNYPSRLMLWKMFLREIIGAQVRYPNPYP